MYSRTPEDVEEMWMAALQLVVIFCSCTWVEKMLIFINCHFLDHSVLDGLHIGGDFKKEDS